MSNPTQLFRPPPVTDAPVPRGLPPERAPVPPQDGWDAAFQELQAWKRQSAWTAAEGDEDGAE